MRCEDLRLEADQRPAGAVGLSPWLRDHLDGCPPCRHWEEERVRWGDLGALLRDPVASADAGDSMDVLGLRARVRASIPAAPAPWIDWLRPVLGAMAAATLMTVVLTGGLRMARQQTNPKGETSLNPLPQQEAGLLHELRQGAVSTPRDIDPALATPAWPRPGEPRPAEPASRSAARRGRHEPDSRQATTPDLQVVRSGDDFAIEWASNHTAHRIVRSFNPADFSSGKTMLVQGPRWVDSSSGSENIQFYLID